MRTKTRCPVRNRWSSKRFLFYFSVQDQISAFMMEVVTLEMGIRIDWERNRYLYFLDCENQKCTKKIKHVDQQMLLALAERSGWEKTMCRWLCPSCVKNIGQT